MPGNQFAHLPTATPQFWNGQNLTLGILAAVDGKIYNLFGVTSHVDGSHDASVMSVNYTATHTMFVLDVGRATFTLDFFSPVSPNNHLRQSLPFSYLTISVRISGSASRRIQVYCDIDETWAGQVNSTGQVYSTVSNFTSSARTSIFQLSLRGAPTYWEANDMALWGNVVFASAYSNSTTTSSQSGSPNAVRNKFVADGSLSNDTSAYAPGDVVAITHDLGMVSTEMSVTFAIGYEREEVVNYTGNARTGYYRALYPDIASAVSYFLSDYTPANNESRYIDSTLETKAVVAGGRNYSDIILLSTRQAFGALDLTIPNDSFDTGDVMIFVKEISSDGNINTMDVIYPMFPIFYVMCPEYIRLILEPVVQYLATGRWKQLWVIHDIGNYPNATGHDNQIDENQQLEETGNLILLVWAYTMASGNRSFYSEHATLLQAYANYLELNTLNSTAQISSDDSEPSLEDQTNLAIKASIGLNAFGALSGISNYSFEGRNYASVLYNTGYATDINGTHFKIQYQNVSQANNASYIMAYNLFPDNLLNLSTFPLAAYEMASHPYPSLTPPEGVPLDSRVDWGKTDWMMFTAAFSWVYDNATTTMLINDVHALMANQHNDVPFSDRYHVKGPDAGLYYGFKARPVVGGHFALLAMQGSNLLGLT